jgi:indolepyruvate ferredoxin oxidoreductase
MTSSQEAQIVRADFTLNERYEKESGVIFLSGIQALARLLLEQHRRDRRAGLNTGGFVSGYRGSPLGGLDQVLWQQKALLESHNVQFQPGVNEELAATAVWGSQQVGLFPGATVDGVYGLWYGKAPGLDRACDAIRHANAAGTAENGGVLLVVGDDHGCKSSTLPSHSELALKDLGIPVLNPANVQDVLDYGLFGWALSRYSGCWTGLIALADNMDSSGTVLIDDAISPYVMPERIEEVNITAGRAALEQEALLHEVKLPLAIQFARANGINRVLADPADARLGIIATGKAYLDVREALAQLSLVTEQDIERAGIRLLKLGMSWPLDEEEMVRFSRGLETLLVVEEKRAFVEEELKSLLFNQANGMEIVGKRSAQGEALLAGTGEIRVADVAKTLSRYIEERCPGARIDRTFLERTTALSQALVEVTGQAKTDRLPMFCAGCPHNTSTRVPEGSRASAGIGCHYMAQWMDRETSTFTQMGGEGANWTGQAPFTDEEHIFVNLGDGTYFHSGLLAIRQAVASGANMTYKILVNDAVAMTGGQPVDGELDVPQLVAQLRAEGVEHVEIVSDAPTALGHPGAPVHHRDDLDAVQRRFREIKGCSVIIYQQTCATELRRRRKRGLADDPDVRVMINDAVCEGCGDCSVQSNCVAVEPLVTELGIKRQINQTACNKDLSCVKGFCPAFVLVRGAELRKPKGVAAELAELREKAPLPDATLDAANVLIAGVGGTGVVTVSALLGTAAHIDGLAVSTLDMTGLAQKGGAVFGHVRIAPDANALHGTRIAAGQTDLLLACDLITGASRDALTLADGKKTLSVVNTDVVPTAEFVLHQDADHHGAERLARLESFSREARTVDGARLCARLLGSTATLNVFLLGFAWQQGLIPVSIAALERAIELNGTAVTDNLKAFHFGRIAAWSPDALELGGATAAEAANGRGPMDPLVSDDLESLIAARREHLTAYQGRQLADRFENLVRRVQVAEQGLGAATDDSLARAVAESYAKLLAYKDEYEVARLYADGRFAARMEKTFEAGYRQTYLLAPPLMGAKKRRFGAWMGAAYGWLAKLKFLRGTPLDVFGYMAERKQERWSIEHFESVVGELLAELDRSNHGLAVRIAGLADVVRGYGHIKEANRERWLEEEGKLLEEFHRPPAPVLLFDPAKKSAA